MHKYLAFLFFDNNISISVKSAAQIFLLLNFLFADFCNCPAKCSFTIIPDPVFVWKKQ